MNAELERIRRRDARSHIVGCCASWIRTLPLGDQRIAVRELAEAITFAPAEDPLPESKAAAEGGGS